jgi:hypothetical protein
MGSGVRLRTNFGATHARDSIAAFIHLQRRVFPQLLLPLTDDEDKLTAEPATIRPHPTPPVALLLFPEDDIVRGEAVIRDSSPRKKIRSTLFTSIISLRLRSFARPLIFAPPAFPLSPNPCSIIHFRVRALRRPGRSFFCLARHLHPRLLVARRVRHTRKTRSSFFLLSSLSSLLRGGATAFFSSIQPKSGQ